MMHPMHIHLVQFQVLERQCTGQPGAADPWELNTWKDTVGAAERPGAGDHEVRKDSPANLITAISSITRITR
jgi:FtsP/CotA-like multicopper oxidase with cupredoxin domain